MLVVVAFAAFARAAGILLPSQPALIVSVATMLLLPGWALAVALGLGRRLDSVALMGLLPGVGLAAWVPALALGFAAGLTFDGVLAIMAVQTVVLLAVGGSPPARAQRPDLATTALVVLVAAVASARWQHSLSGDAVFHLARVQKLLAVPHLSLDSVSEMAGGKPHAGYVFPLLHAVEAAALWLAGITPAAGFQDLVPAAAMLAALASFAAGRAVAGAPVGAAVAAVVLWASVTGAHPTLGMVCWPGPFTLLALFPVAILALTELVRTPGHRGLQGVTAATAFVVALVHVSYAVPLLALMFGTVAYARRGIVGIAAAATATMCVFAFVWWAALRGVPKPVVQAGPWRHANASAFIMERGHAVALNAGTITAQQIGFLVAVLALVPLLIWQAPRFAYPAALMSGGLALVALPGFATLLNATVGVGQTHRFGAAVPWEIVIAVLAAVVVIHVNRYWVVSAVALLGFAAAAGPASLKSLWAAAPSLPTTPVAVAAVLGAVWYAVRGIRATAGPAMQAAIVPTVLVALAAVALSTPPDVRTVASHLIRGHVAMERQTIPTAIVNWISDHAGPMPVVLTYQIRSYQLGAYVPAYVVAVPEVRTRAEPASMPDQRRRQVAAFLSAATSESARDALIRRYGVDIVIVRRTSSGLVGQLRADSLLRQRLVVGSPGGDWLLFAVAPGGQSG